MKKLAIGLGLGALLLAVPVILTLLLVDATDHAVGYLEGVGASFMAPSGLTLPPMFGGTLLPSFQIPGGETLSHVPAVVYTADGALLIAATSGSELLIFEAATRKLLRRVKLPHEATDAISIDPRGRTAAWVLKKGGLAVIDLESEKLLACDPSPTVKRVAISPDGLTLAASGDAKIELRRLPSLSRVDTVAGHEGEVTNLAWSPDGRLLASTGKDGRLLVHDVPARLVLLEKKKGRELHAVAFHPRGTALAYGGHDRQVYQHDLETGREEIVSQSQPYIITSLGYSPDGELLAVGDESCDIWLYKLKSKELAFHNKHHLECWLGNVAWTPDNATFLFSCRPNAHAAKPAVYAGNRLLEAAQSGPVRHSRTALLKALEDSLATAKDPEERESLEAHRKALANEESAPALAGADSGTYGLSLEGASFSGNNWADLTVVPIEPVTLAPPTAHLPPEIRQMIAEHQESLKKESEKLQAYYCLNAWQLRK